MKLFFSVQIDTVYRSRPYLTRRYGQITQPRRKINHMLRDMRASDLPQRLVCYNQDEDATVSVVFYEGLKGSFTPNKKRGLLDMGRFFIPKTLVRKTNRTNTRIRTI